MVIIHGGGFMAGSARMYRDYGDISDSFVSKGIVVVVIQYRLSLYGITKRKACPLLHSV